MPVYFVLAVAAIIGVAIAVAAFHWPDRVFMGSAIAAICAWALPYVAAFILTPFLGEGAGLGVALILYVLSGAIVFAAVAAAIGAAARYIWRAMQG